jgi:predicted transcriptional regulator
MNKKHYKILEAIQLGYDSGGVNTSMLKEKFSDMQVDIYHYIRLLNSEELIIKNERWESGVRKQNLMPTSKGRDRLEQYKKSCIKSTDNSVNIEEIGKKYGEFDIEIASNELMLSYSKTSVWLTQACDSGILERRKDDKDGRKWIYSLTQEANSSFVR